MLRMLQLRTICLFYPILLNFGCQNEDIFQNCVNSVNVIKNFLACCEILNFAKYTFSHRFFTPLKFYFN